MFVCLCVSACNNYYLNCALDPCKTNNGGCDSKRKCTNAGKGVATCGDCPAPQINDGAKGCKGLCLCVYVCMCVFTCALMSVN